ncbi:cytochrome c oxidase subunit 4 [Blastococcus sp. MG754426]|uniref:cytochrome c oxidase subunit 4 n=1 Tax=unclassified Blastococcus TaxID=2619396 RepID=UPI001EEF8D46|nr:MULTISPECIES: cytochrome c oxidase subunit 4 [unclassified Blastococcus]MCF6508360.1 cytochrome c oxidase subunit 4 [Blastococcus sp. MG754426]MCF6510942.1 cytochrome c oxidase subunit 4 [Blastococcus sp. MG754427]MCF6733977.1 cytochrome c oxidase subunit 4 [Blastococcus sp. KM273129]
MKVEALIFNLIAVFCFVCAIVYGVWAREPIGTTALTLSGGLTILIGGFFWFVSRRIDLRPEDRKDAEIADGAGELGFFSPASYWPFTLALSAGLMGLGVAFWYYWLMLMAAVAILVAVGGLLFEYYVGQNAQQS